MDELETFFQQKNPSVIYINDGVNSDSGIATQKPSQTFLERYERNTEDLFHSITECRVHKNPQELSMLQFITQLTCEAHVEVMRRVKPGMREY